MLKTIALLVLSSALVAILFTSCSEQTSDEPTSVTNDRIIAAIDKSVPISEGNLITKTETDENGNLKMIDTLKSDVKDDKDVFSSTGAGCYGVYAYKC